MQAIEVSAIDLPVGLVAPMLRRQSTQLFFPLQQWQPSKHRQMRNELKLPREIDLLAEVFRSHVQCDGAMRRERPTGLHCRVQVGDGHLQINQDPPLLPTAVHEYRATHRGLPSSSALARMQLRHLWHSDQECVDEVLLAIRDHVYANSPQHH